MDIFCRPLALLIAVMVCVNPLLYARHLHSHVVVAMLSSLSFRLSHLYLMYSVNAVIWFAGLAHSQHIAVWKTYMLLCGIRLVRRRRLTRRQSIDLTFGVKHLSFILHNLLPRKPTVLGVAKDHPGPVTNSILLVPVAYEGST
ncbi:hypothetical protein BDR04DRAFT_230231 [Suillus decipiens]|nr:hypothetical protein BDR04DRAFT_230231 [Suillus decipiens]